MDFRDAFQGLRVEIAKHKATFETARGGCAALASYATPGAVVAALAPRSGLTAAERDTLTLALIEQQQRAPHALWQSLLLLAYEPLLRRFLGRLRTGDDQEPAQVVLFAFLRAIANLPVNDPPARIALYLRTSVAEQVFASLRRDRRAADVEIFDEEAGHGAGEAFRARERVDQMVEVVRALDDQRDCAVATDMVFATLGHGETLLEYVARTLPHATRAERARVYARLRDRRAALVAMLRARVWEGKGRRLARRPSRSGPTEGGQ
jgi:hypothetical protein